jgi:hypothetical protein
MRANGKWVAFRLKLDVLCPLKQGLLDRRAREHDLLFHLRDHNHWQVKQKIKVIYEFRTCFSESSETIQMSKEMGKILTYSPT